MVRIASTSNGDGGLLTKFKILLDRECEADKWRFYFAGRSWYCALGEVSSNPSNTYIPLLLSHTRRVRYKNCTTGVVRLQLSTTFSESAVNPSAEARGCEPTHRLTLLLSLSRSRR